MNLIKKKYLLSIYITSSIALSTDVYGLTDNRSTSKPISSTVSYESLRIMAYSGQPDLAIKLAEEFLKSNENDSIRILLARLLGWNKQFDAARDQLNYVLKRNPGDYDATDALSDIEIWAGNESLAIAAINNSLKYNKNKEALLEKRDIIQANLYLKQGQPDQAINLAKEYLKTHDTNNMRSYLANLYLSRGNYADAENELQHILKNDPNQPKATAALANVYLSKGDKKNAVEIIDTALKIYPSSTILVDAKNKIITPTNQPTLPSSTQIITPATAVLGTSYIELKKLSESGNRRKAIELAKNDLKQADNTDIRLLLANMQAWDGQYNDARTNFNLILKKNPANSDASQGLANVEIWSGHPTDAITIINKGLKYNPNDKNLIALRAKANNQGNSKNGTNTLSKIRAMALNGQRDNAKKLARAYLRENEDVDVRTLLGLMELWDAEYQDAQVQFTKVLDKKPGYSDASVGLAKVNLANNNYKEALRIINNGLKISPKNKDLIDLQTQTMQNLGLMTIPVGIGNVFGTTYIAGTGFPENKLNALKFNQEVSYVDDLKQTWKITSLAYERYTTRGPIIFTYNHADRFNTTGEQYVVESYPKLFKGAYMYLGYGYSDTSYFPKNYIGYEPFFSLPGSFEFSAGERILQFQSSVTQLLTGSFAKYIGNYWFALRPYFSNTGGKSYYLTARRYFSSPESYITLTVGGGSGPSNFTDPNNIASDRSRSVKLSGQVPLTTRLYFNWVAAYSTDHFPNTNVRQETDIDGGLIWYF